MEANRQYEYVIGIDLGHGETSAAICPLQWDNAPGELDTHDSGLPCPQRCLRPLLRHEPGHLQGSGSG